MKWMNEKRLENHFKHHKPQVISLFLLRLLPRFNKYPTFHSFSSKDLRTHSYILQTRKYQRFAKLTLKNDKSRPHAGGKPPPRIQSCILEYTAVFPRHAILGWIYLDPMPKNESKKEKGDRGDKKDPPERGQGAKRTPRQTLNVIIDSICPTVEGLQTLLPTWVYIAWSKLILPSNFLTRVWSETIYALPKVIPFIVNFDGTFFYLIASLSRLYS